MNLVAPVDDNSMSTSISCGKHLDLARIDLHFSILVELIGSMVSQPLLPPVCFSTFCDLWNFLKATITAENSPQVSSISRRCLERCC